MLNFIRHTNNLQETLYKCLAIFYLKKCLARMHFNILKIKNFKYQKLLFLNHNKIDQNRFL